MEKELKLFNFIIMLSLKDFESVKIKSQIKILGGATTNPPNGGCSAATTCNMTVDSVTYSKDSDNSDSKGDYISTDLQK